MTLLAQLFIGFLTVFTATIISLVAFCLVLHLVLSLIERGKL